MCSISTVSCSMLVVNKTYLECVDHILHLPCSSHLSVKRFSMADSARVNNDFAFKPVLAENNFGKDIFTSE